MIKNYINVRVFVMLDIILLTTWVVLLINGWPVIAAYPMFDAIVLAAFSIPLVGIATFSIYQRSQLVQRKHTHIQYIHEQEEEYRVTYLQQQQLPPYPDNSIAIAESEEDEQLSQQAGSGGTLLSAIPESQSIPHGIVAQDEILRNCNVAVARQLSANPGMSMNQMIKATGYSRGTIGRTNAWKDRSR